MAIVTFPEYKTIQKRIPPTEIVINIKKTDKNVAETIKNILIAIVPERLSADRATKSSNYYHLNELKEYIQQILKIPDLIKYSEDGESLIRELNDGKAKKESAVKIIQKLYNLHVRNE